MKGLLCYHSQSGNTALVCRFLSQKLNQVDWDLFDITTGNPPNLASYAVVGFATWTYYLALPPFFEQFLDSLPTQTGKPAFVLNTFGVMPGQALYKMNQTLTAKGFNVLGGYSFHAPESYPPYIAKGWHSLEAPTAKELGEFSTFCAQLGEQLENLSAGMLPKNAKIKLDLFSRLIQPYSESKIRREMEALSIDPVLCNQCGSCLQACLYGAIADAAPTPAFQPEKCKGCWACFNHCPQKAIFSEKIQASNQYPQPAEALLAKLGG